LPQRKASRALCGKVPPTMIGGCGFWTGFGHHRLEVHECEMILSL
jgi:hypothetical protein